MCLQLQLLFLKFILLPSVTTELVLLTNATYWKWDLHLQRVVVLWQSLNVRSNFQKVEEVNNLPKCPVSDPFIQLAISIWHFFPLSLQESAIEICFPFNIKLMCLLDLVDSANLRHTFFPLH